MVPANGDKLFWLVHTADADETKLSCLVLLPIVFTPPTWQFCLVSTQFRWVLFRLNRVSNSQLIACSHRRRGQDKTVFVSFASAVWAQLETRQNCLVLSVSAVWTSDSWPWVDSTVFAWFVDSVTFRCRTVTAHHSAAVRRASTWRELRRVRGERKGLSSRLEWTFSTGELSYLRPRRQGCANRSSYRALTYLVCFSIEFHNKT